MTISIIISNPTVKIVVILLVCFLIIYPIINIDILDGELSFIMIVMGAVLLIYVLDKEDKNRNEKKRLYYKYK